MTPHAMSKKEVVFGKHPGGYDYIQNEFEGLKIEAGEAVLLDITPRRGKLEAEVDIILPRKDKMKKGE